MFRHSGAHASPESQLRAALCIGLTRKGNASRSAEQVGDGGDGGFDCPLADVSEAQHQRRQRHGFLVTAVGADAVQPNQAFTRRGDHGRLVRAWWQRGDSVESGREPGELDSGGVPGERVGQRGAAGGVDGSHPPQGISTNLSSAALLVQAITATLSRWQAGRHGDRYGHARLLIPALAVAALGLATMTLGLVTMTTLGSPTVIFAGMVLFGAGFGVIENATFALLIEQLPEAKASALWNLAYDAGYGAGPAAFGLICVRTG